MVTKKDLTGVILAGGQSSRMGGKDKGLLIFNERPLISFSFDVLKDKVQHCLISANRNIDAYKKYTKVIADCLDDYQGPLAGISSALEATQTPYLLVLPCDAAYVEKNLVERLIMSMRDNQVDICIASDGVRMQPTFAIMRTKIKANLQEFLDQDNRKLELWVRQNNHVIVDCADMAHQFVNFNKPEDLLEY